ncbi:hypothetical protein ACU635_50140 [[Actinomadura] parvosata]|uniref:hypothetical protein n=1 Tax=[Actinomadura] parvosata TaxID=1955412 RepID=UPI00406D1ACB
MGVLSAITGALINLLTDSWSWGIFTLAALLLIMAGSITYRLEADNERLSGENGSRVNQRAGIGSRILRSGVQARSRAAVDQIASGGGCIADSEIEARGSVVRQIADSGTITDSPITAV